MKTYPTPHDSLFKKFFSDVDIARDFLSIHLPPSLRELCDFSTLAVTACSFVNDDLGTQHSDMLYSLRTSSGPGYIYCLIEHQSRPDKLMAFRLMRYSIAAMQYHLDQGHKTVPLVIPMLFYHGKKTPYPYSTCWFDCFHDPIRARKVYNEIFSLVDLTVISDEEIKTHKKVGVLEYVQKHIWQRNFAYCLQDFIHLLEVSSLTKEQVKSLLNYLAIKANIIDTKQFIDKLVENAPDHRKEVMTIADYMEQQGLQKGLQKGLQRGRDETRVKIALNLLAMGMEPLAISHSTGLTERELTALRNQAS